MDKKRRFSYYVMLLILVLLIMLSLLQFYMISRNQSVSTYYETRADVKDFATSMQADIFPVRLTKRQIQLTGVGYNYNCMKRCHDTYEAADIGAPTGTDVYLISGGTVLSVTERSVVQGKSGGSSIRIRGDDGWFYYYTHMLPGSVDVVVGDHLTKGRILGRVGREEDAEGAPPHVHVDMSRIDNGFARGAGVCSDECTYLIAPQQVLRQAYEALPEG